MGHKVDKYCKDCKFMTDMHGNIKICDYMFKTGKPRGCPPGEGCTKKEVVKWVAT